VNRASIERMCACKQFQVEGADTEKAGEEKLLVIPGGLVRRPDLGQVVHTHLPLLRRSIIWHRSTGGDALRLGR